MLRKIHEVKEHNIIQIMILLVVQIYCIIEKNFMAGFSLLYCYSHAEFEHIASYL